MRVLMTSDTVGGVFSYTVELARALAEHDVQIVLATLGRDLDHDQAAVLRTIPRLEVHESSFKLEWMDEPWTDVRLAGSFLQRLAARVRPDCIHLNQFAFGSLRWPAPVLLVAHSCVTSWWHAVEGGAPPARYDVYRRAVMAGLFGADLVVAPSQAMLASLHAHYGTLPRTRVIPNGIDVGALQPAPKQPFVLAAGRLWDRGKNVAALQRVAAGLEWPIYLAGEPAALAQPDAEAGRCHPLGRLSRAELFEQLARAAIYALPALYEPFGLSVLEAAASGCALVLGRIPSLYEHWHDAAWFVDPRDPNELRDALECLIADPVLRNQLGARAHSRAQAFASQRMARAYLGVFDQLRSARSVRGQPCAS